MKYITVIAMIAIVLLDITLLKMTDAIAQSSVGGTLTLSLAFVAAALAVAIHEAWSKKRSIVGWTVNIGVSLVGALLATIFSGVVIEPILLLINLDEQIAAVHPLHFVPSAVMMLHALFGSWVALSIVNQWR